MKRIYYNAKRNRGVKQILINGVFANFFLFMIYCEKPYMIYHINYKVKSKKKIYQNLNRIIFKNI